MLMRHQYGGGCHCLAIEVELSTVKPARELTTKLCLCTFCRKHGARAFSDPSARAVLFVREPNHLQRYRFGLNAADVALCRRCGVYVAMVLQAEGIAWATINVQALQQQAMFTTAPVSVDFDAEEIYERIQRRKAEWTPTELVGWPG